jgi:hypothetical protein
VTAPEAHSNPAAPPKPRVHAYNDFSLDASAKVSAVALGLTSTGAFLAPFADARSDAGLRRWAA